MVKSVEVGLVNMNNLLQFEEIVLVAVSSVVSAITYVFMTQNALPSLEQILRGTAVAAVYAGILFMVVRLAHRNMTKNIEKLKNGGDSNGFEETEKFE